jgi:hypothetical protein
MARAFPANVSLIVFVIRQRALPLSRQPLRSETGGEGSHRRHGADVVP